jgi:prepilin-type N-terminal cleavage/methylation domain-containing protein
MRKAFTLIEILVVTAIIFIFLSVIGGGLISLFGGAFPHYSDGSRAGTVYKISNKGMIFKSYEGEMNLGGMAADANGQMTVNTFRFSAKDPTIVKQIEAAANSGQRVTLHYNQYLIKPITIDTEYVINKVETIEDKKK